MRWIQHNDQPDDAPALPDRSKLTHSPSQDPNQETTKPSTTHEYLELIDVGEEKNGTAECWSECCVQPIAGFQDLHKATISDDSISGFE